MSAPLRPLVSAVAWRPLGTSKGDWARVAAPERVTLYVESIEGERFEIEGSNRGPWVRFFMRGDEGQAWCAAFLLRAIESVGAPRPLGDPRYGRWAWYYPNRSVARWEQAAKRGGTWSGPACPPKRGDLCFRTSRSGSDKGRGRHVDLVTDYDPATRTVHLIGGNVSNRIKRRSVRLGDPSVSGFGQITPHVTALRGLVR